MYSTGHLLRKPYRKKSQSEIYRKQKKSRADVRVECTLIPIRSPIWVVHRFISILRYTIYEFTLFITWSNWGFQAIGAAIAAVGSVPPLLFSSKSRERERERGRNLLFQDVFPLRKVYFSFVLLFAYLTSSRRGPVDRCLDRELRTAIFVVRTAAVVQIVATKH